jgi:hypothetical protein
VFSLSVRSITTLVTKVMAAAGVEEAAHRLRHTLATRLVRDHGRDLALVADVLGHADAKTTRRYARSELEDRRTALKRSTADSQPPNRRSLTRLGQIAVIRLSIYICGVERHVDVSACDTVVSVVRHGLSVLVEQLG